MRTLLRTLSVLTLLGLMACHPKVDASSTPKLVASVSAVRLALDAEQRDRFDSALLTVAFRDLTDKDLLDLAKHADQILPDARASIDGKTGEQIIAQARRLKKQRKD